ncbi:hypothetical protein DYB38_005727 [Aphanomyces astaci]|uniref:FYVE-type domain-containing protein n=2 Tax=Aphanomyces astaci TaxID=112090 RepID=A0A397CRJ9_APHAT|nr:hypothetical protein DYB38_005727 [Aphanomyces astaci]
MLFGPQVVGNPAATATTTQTKKAALSSSTSIDEGGIDKKKKKRSKAAKKSNDVDASSTTSTSTSRRDRSKKKLARPLNVSPHVDMSCMYATVWKGLKYLRKTTTGTLHKPICVTGVDGFLAAWIVEKLLVKGYKVRGTVQNKNDDISKLYDLPSAKKHLTIVETSLLTAQSCDLAVDGCDFVIHTGTPTSCSVRDPFSEKQEPGVYSISSRVHCIVPMMNNFITACVRAKVKRVVLTSSIAAMADSVDAQSQVTDLSWNVTSSLDRNPHFLSLKLAEEAAWQLVKNESMELPGMLIGPSLCNSKISPGTQVIYDLIVGHYSALVDLNFAMADVRDCAAAHVLALEHMDARGRYICVHRTVWLREMVQILSRNGNSGRALPLQVVLPHWVANFGYALQLGQVGVSLYAEPDATSSGPPASPYSHDKLLDVFKFNDQTAFRSVDDTVVDSAKDLLKWHLIKPWHEDHSVTACVCCGTPFGVLFRKHHCRECGRIVCNACSLSRAVVEGFDDKQRFCDGCVLSAVPALLAGLADPRRDVAVHCKAVVVLESLMENQKNHELLARGGGIPILLQALHATDDIVAVNAAGALHKLSQRLPTALQLVLEGTVLHMLEMEEGSAAWRVCLLALKNFWGYVARRDFKTMLIASVRVTPDTASGTFRGNVMLSLVHLLDPSEWLKLIPEGLIPLLLDLLHDDSEYAHRTVAHAIKHMLPTSYRPTIDVDVPSLRETYDRDKEAIDVWFVVGAHKIAANRVVLSVQNPFFKRLLGTFPKHVEVSDVNNHTFSLLIHFLYTEEVAIDLHNAVDLLVAAALYHVPELQKRVERFLVDEITAHNAMGLWAVAHKCLATDLETACVAFILRNICAVAATEGFTAHHRSRVTTDVVAALCRVLGPPWSVSFNAMAPKDLRGLAALADVATLPDDDGKSANDVHSEWSSVTDELAEGIC